MSRLEYDTVFMRSRRNIIFKNEIVNVKTCQMGFSPLSLFGGNHFLMGNKKQTKGEIRKLTYPSKPCVLISVLLKTLTVMAPFSYFRITEL